MSYRIVTDHPVAYDAPDHTDPAGAKNDDTHCPAFVAACERVIERRPIRVLDIGCAGGGLVADFLAAGHEALGIEGSDYPRRQGLGAWPALGPRGSLLTADMRQRLRIYRNHPGMVNWAMFDITTAWEFWEHIPEEHLYQAMKTLWYHTTTGGLHVASIAQFECPPHHVTLCDRDWWRKRFEKARFREVPSPFAIHEYPRGSGNGENDWDVREHPEYGFHIVLEAE